MSRNRTHDMVKIIITSDASNCCTTGACIGKALSTLHTTLAAVHDKAHQHRQTTASSSLTTAAINTTWGPDDYKRRLGPQVNYFYVPFLLLLTNLFSILF